jgi:enterochelin esterase family protein
MGGGQTLQIGLTHPERFAWIGSFGAAIRNANPELSYAGFFSDPAAANERLKLLWIGCGREDALFAANQGLHDALVGRGIRHVFHPSPGGHTWVNWRAYYIEFLPLLFQP